jgi:hypothetical protein
MELYFFGCFLLWLCLVFGTKVLDGYVTLGELILMWFIAIFPVMNIFMGLSVLGSLLFSRGVRNFLSTKAF